MMWALENNLQAKENPLSLTQGAPLSHALVPSGDELEVLSRLLAIASGHEFVLNALTLDEFSKARPLNGRDVHKGVGSTTLGLDESIALGVVEPLYDSGIQDISLS